jgi:competence ComEA-like helix-hairpin-helix protein
VLLCGLKEELIVGTRQEIGIITVVILIALSSWWSQSTPEVVEEGSFDCPFPAVVVDQNNMPKLVCEITNNSQPLSGIQNILIGSLISVNTAQAKDLEAIPKIGPVMAQRIIEFRKERGKITSLDELLQVKGIGPKRLEFLEKYLKN